MSKRLKLKQKTEENIYTVCKTLYYSGFCLTDNENFCQFYVKKYPKLGYQFKKFNFEEKDLIFDIDSEEQFMLKDGKIQFERGGVIDPVFYNLFRLQFKDLKFFRLREFMNSPVNMKILVFDDAEGKAVGLLNLKTPTGKEDKVDN